MPFVKICVTKEGDSPSVEQKEKMISGVTKLISEILGRSAQNTVVIIDEIDTNNYGIAGESVKNIRKKQKEQKEVKC
ncbi:2-hydroxymuconate tautomerase family protein [Campylobacter concisus]|uniref:2-hydroxymuconate tautomerase family protein n=1 Tax=Campylobacter concisus TaxID=199 RepID=UPI00025A677A|nr:2-hydroxymuconate tautomerase family protein [Campylobacter concisus]EIF07650.1 Putative isomerase [Campylobacter concisus UNSWCD]